MKRENFGFGGEKTALIKCLRNENTVFTGKAPSLLVLLNFHDTSILESH